MEVTVSGSFRIVKPNSLVLAKRGDLHRIPPRPVRYRQANYDARFDFDTVFCDVFDDAIEGVVVNGPPLLNLTPIFSEATYTNAESGAIGQPCLQDLGNSQHSVIKGLGRCHTMKVQFGDGLSREIPVSENECELFRGRNCLVTVSKDNELVWIRDWARFYAELHGIDAILLYDNGSTKYTSSDVLDAISGVEGIEVAVVVEWPFPFGPQAGNWDGLKGARWDSSYCQSTLLEHARWRYLNEAYGVLHCDIDELMVSVSGNIFDDLSASEGLVYFRGRWVEAIRKDGATGVPRFVDYRWRDDRRRQTTRKWLIDPVRCSRARAWRTHRVLGVKGELSRNTMHRHFRGISTGWKFTRPEIEKINSEHHFRDVALQSALDRAFEGEEAFSFEDHRPQSPTTVRGRVRAIAETLSPEPATVRFEDRDHLTVEFDTGSASFSFGIRFHGPLVSTTVQARDDVTAANLGHLFADAGPWALDTDSMRHRSKATVASNVIAHLQARLNTIVEQTDGRR